MNLDVASPFFFCIRIWSGPSFFRTNFAILLCLALSFAAAITRWQKPKGRWFQTLVLHLDNQMFSAPPFCIVLQFTECTFQGQTWSVFAVAVYGGEPSRLRVTVSLCLGAGSGSKLGTRHFDNPPSPPKVVALTPVLHGLKPEQCRTVFEWHSCFRH